LNLPEGHKQRTIYDTSATKINALIKGFVQRLKYKKIYFMYLVTGMKPNQFSSKELAAIPKSEVFLGFEQRVSFRKNKT